MTAADHPFHGSVVALPTPLRGGRLDLEALDRLVEFHGRSGTDAVHLGGTLGEGWTLSLDEGAQLVARAAAAAERHTGCALAVIFEIVETDTRRAARLAEQAVLAGADGVALCAPPGLRAGGREMLVHLEQVVERVQRDTPVMLVNEPNRSGADLDTTTILAAAERFPQVRAHCEGVGFPGRARSLPGRLAEAGLATLTSDDRMVGPYLRAGAAGAVTAVGNLVPAELRALLAAIQDDRHDADRRERALGPLVDLVRMAPGPVALKAALAALGAMDPEVRPPLAPLEPRETIRVAVALEVARLLVPSAAV